MLSKNPIVFISVRENYSGSHIEGSCNLWGIWGKLRKWSLALDCENWKHRESVCVYVMKTKVCKNYKAIHVCVYVCVCVCVCVCVWVLHWEQRVCVKEERAVLCECISFRISISVLKEVNVLKVFGGLNVFKLFLLFRYLKICLKCTVLSQW